MRTTGTGFQLHEYCRINFNLRPDVDQDLVGDLTAVIEDGPPAAAKKAKQKLFLEMERARALRDLGLPRGLREKVRAFEQAFVDRDTPNTPPACFSMDSDLAPSAYLSYGGAQ